MYVTKFLSGQHHRQQADAMSGMLGCVTEYGPSPAPVTTTVVWESVVGAQLEELLYGLLEELGADELVWRAGTTSGVTASDGGRDLQAVFDQPTPDGDLDRTRWWIEAKGRTGTVSKDEVITGVMNAAGRVDLDYYVFCTNSRFSNPTRDWVEEWQKSHPRPKIRLWDRDRLASMVRQHPTVAARVLPEALDDQQRLRLLIDRFAQLGETPTDLDLNYFWERRSAVAASSDIICAVSMLTYAESNGGLMRRPWSTLLPNDPVTALTVLLDALVYLPIRSIRPRPRPLSMERVIEVSSYIIISVFHRLPAEIIHQAFVNPYVMLESGDAMRLRTDDGAVEEWRGLIAKPILSRIKGELTDVCGGDCARIDARTRAFEPQVDGKRYWSRFGVCERDKKEDSLVMELFAVPCVVGLPLDNKRTCPLIADFELTLERIEEFRQVIVFRRENPDGQRSKVAPKLTEKQFEEIVRVADVEKWLGGSEENS